MSQKKAMRNRFHRLAKEVTPILMPSDGHKTIMAHLLWSVPAREMRAHFVGAGPKTMIRLTDARDPAHAPELTLTIDTRDALVLISEEVDEDMIQIVADDYHELIEPLFPDGVIATVAIDMADGSAPHIAVMITPEDYEMA